MTDSWFIYVTEKHQPFSADDGATEREGGVWAEESFSPEDETFTPLQVKLLMSSNQKLESKQVFNFHFE